MGGLSCSLMPLRIEIDFYGVMAGLVPAIHVWLDADKDVDARDKRGHDKSMRSDTH